MQFVKNLKMFHLRDVIVENNNKDLAKSAMTKEELAKTEKYFLSICLNKKRFYVNLRIIN